jgi:hypothetical protein
MDTGDDVKSNRVDIKIQAQRTENNLRNHSLHFALIAYLNVKSAEKKKK